MIEKIINNFKDNNRIAYIIENEKITYKELLEKANNLANYFLEKKINRVIIQGEKEIYMIISILASLIAKITYIPIDKSIPKKRLESIIELAKPEAMITEEKEHIKNIKRIDFNKIIGKKPQELININYNKNSTAYIMFTSGTTGIPKGVPITYENLDNFCNWLNTLLPIKDYHNINVLNQANFNFDLSIADLFYSWITTNTLVALNQQIIDNDLYDYIKKNDITFAVLTPTFLKILLLNPNFNEKKFPLKCIYLCGEYLDVSLARKVLTRFPSLSLINAYGPTECTSAVSSVLITKEMLEKEILPIGEIKNAAVDIKIINEEIVLSGRSVFNGYLNGEKTNNVYYTKDSGFIKDGYLYFKGRMDSQIKLSGYRIELLEIENKIKSHPNVMDAVVIAKKDEKGKTKWLNAYIVSTKKTDMNSYLKEYLPKYMIPKNIYYVDRLPISNNKKTERKEEYYDEFTTNYI